MSQQTSPRPERISRRSYDLGYRLLLGVMLGPYLIGLVLLVVIPAVLTASVAFTEFDALSPPELVGFANFEAMFRDEVFWTGLRASMLFIALAVPLRVVGALLLALLAFRKRRGVGAFRAAVYLPTIVPDVAYGLLWLFIFNPLFGPLNQFLLWFPRPVEAVETGALDLGWTIHPMAAPVGVVLMCLWTIGEGFVLLMAALQDIPAELYENAEIDGAGPLESFRSITLPLVAPFLLLLIFRDTVISFQLTFVAAQIVTHGGPYYVTTYLPYWIYLNASDYQRFGYAAAMTLVLFAVTAVVIGLQFAFARRWRAAYFD